MSKADGWLPKLTKINDVLIEGDLPYRRWTGSWGSFHVIVGQPKPTLDGKDYYCPIQARGCFKGVRLVMGGASFDSLVNAIGVVTHYWHYLNGLGELPEVLPRPTLRRWRGRHRPARSAHSR